MRWLHLRFASVSGLPERCWAAGVPPGPDGPACASTPEGLRAGRPFFALELPYDIMTDAGRRSIWLVNPDTGAQQPLEAGEGLAPCLGVTR